MRKTYPLHIDGRHPDRVLDAIKHDVRKYLKRERRRALPEGADFWDFDCKVAAHQEDAQTVHLSALIKSIDAVAKSQAVQVYVEVLAKTAQRQPRAKPMGDGASLDVEDQLPE